MENNLLLLFIGLELYFGLLTFRFYQAAGRPVWQAFIPVYRTLVLLRIIERPWWWIILCYLPVVGNVMAAVIVFELLHVFKIRQLWHSIVAVITGGLYLGYLNFTEKLDYSGRDIREMRRHVSELVASLIFAIVAATAIRAYTIEAFTIPTSSMEKSLMVGDFLFVSKMHYGSRPPMTPLSLPLIHNTIPFTELNSYLDWIQLPYWRFPKFQEVKRGESVVFNYPAEDIRPINMKGIWRPVDKREHYVKRCVGLPGDTLEIRERQVYHNGEAFRFPGTANPQWEYQVKTNGNRLNPDLLKKRFDINYFLGHNNRAGDVIVSGDNEYKVYIPQKALSAFEQLNNVKQVKPVIQKKPPLSLENFTPKNDTNIIKMRWQESKGLFPNPNKSGPPVFPWTVDNYGPLWIPKAGASIALNEKNYYQYQRAINAYEGQQLERKNGEFFLNGEPATEYTFNLDYYWMMGDNRHRSDDSRFWGFVPEDHIVGKPVFIWMSWDKYAEKFDKIRFDRVFTVVHADGPRRSYFWPFVLVMLAIYFFNRYRKKKKEKKESA